MSPSPAPSVPSSAGTPKRRTLTITLGAVLILGLAGVAARVTHGRAATEPDTKPAPHAAPPALTQSLVTFEPFVVSLADLDEERYLRATVRVVVAGAAETSGDHASPAAAGHAAGDAPGTTAESAALRSRLLATLGSKRAATLSTYEGREALREELKDDVAALLPEREVLDVLFTEFFVQ